MIEREYFQVYYCSDNTGTIVYVGCSGHWEKRHLDHRYRTPWWPVVAQVTFSPRMTRRAALALEAESIRLNRPRYNVQHNPAAIRKPASPTVVRPRPKRQPSYSLADAAARVGISKSAMGRRVRAGTVRKVPHLGSRVVIPHTELVRVFGVTDTHLEVAS